MLGVRIFNKLFWYVNFVVVVEKELIFGFIGIEKLRNKFFIVLKKFYKEKEEERVLVDIWCYFGYVYIIKIDEGEWKICCVLLVVVVIDINLLVFRWNLWLFFF